MGYLHNHKKTSHVSLMQGIGHKVKSLVDFGIGLKGAYDTARTVYSVAQVAMPYIEYGLPLLGVL